MEDDILRIDNSFQLSEISKNLAEFRDQNRYCDVTISVDGQEINAHKCVLAAASKFFDAQLADSENLHSNERTILKLRNDAPFRIIHRIILYLYTGVLEYCNNDVIALVENLSALQIDCRMIVYKLINNKNCFQILNTQQEFHGVNLREVCLGYLAHHLDDLYTCQELKKISKQDMMYILSLLSTLDFEEVTVFLAITKWVEYDTDNRLDYLEEFLNFIPIGSFSCDQLKKYVLPNETLHRSGAACKWFVAVLKDKMNSGALNMCDKLNMYVFSRGPKTAMYSMGSDGDGSFSSVRLIRPALDSFSMTKYKKFIYAIGGKRHGQTINIGLRYDQEQKHWTEFLCPIGKSSCGVWTSKFDKMFVLGGVVGNVSQKSCSCYDYSTNAWLPMPDMLKARWLPGVCAYSSSIYAFGGVSHGDPRPIVERYDHREGIWYQAGMWNCHIGTAAARIRNYIYCLQLGTEKIEAYDPRTLNFETVQEMEENGEWLCAKNDELYVLHKHGIDSGDPRSYLNSAVEENFGAHSILVL